MHRRNRAYHTGMWLLLIIIWLAVYSIFLLRWFGAPFHAAYGAAYLLLLYFCMIKKIGSNINRRYEVHVEAFGRLLSVNLICLLFMLAEGRCAGRLLHAAGGVFLITAVETAVFVICYTIYKMLVRRGKKEEVCFVHQEDGIAASKQKIREGETIFLCDLPADVRNELIKYCYEQGRQVYSTVKLSDILIRGCGLAQYQDSPVLFYDHFGFGAGMSAAKRIFDVTGALSLLIFLSPLFLLIACCIRLEDGGAVFYRQVRCTKDMREFEIYKFRSMVPDAEKRCGARLAGKNDERLTRVGRLIRNTKLDELPQLVNILKGDMSFVGPRPERPEFIAEAIERIPEFVLRTRVKAGLTGYAQVMGTYNTDFLDKLKWDLMYIENGSLFLDVKILLMTFAAVFRKENCEDFSKWER